ncbi:MAG: rhomboid family intramembrane serine protease [Solobacterium sp.]|nr:rhomboid family intramembrane serine protease [Solobacterium sp.]
MNKIRFNSPVVLGFAFISACALAAGYLTNGQSNILLFSVYKGSFKDPLFYVRLFTHVFGHANISHYSNNMILLLLVGPLLEEKYGSGRLAGIMAAVALITGIVHILLPGNSALLGASGIVFAFILLSSVTGSGKGIPLTTVIVAVIYITQQIYDGVTAADNISQLTHIIGGTIGAVYGLTMKRK